MDAELKRRALHRAKILEGQLRGLHRMIEADEYCMDIVTQSLAVQKGLGSLNTLVIENHLREHIGHMMAAGGEQREQAVQELLRMIDLKQNRGD